VTKYSIEVMPIAKKGLASVQKKDTQRIIEKIASLSEDPFPRWTEKLKARMGYRIAVGNYRIIYNIDEDKKMVSILDVDDRKDIYKKT
jgi:mRNA interferase RelE/StbE